MRVKGQSLAHTQGDRGRGCAPHLEPVVVLLQLLVTEAGSELRGGQWLSRAARGSCRQGPSSAQGRPPPYPGQARTHGNHRGSAGGGGAWMGIPSPSGGPLPTRNPSLGTCWRSPGSFHPVPRLAHSPLAPEQAVFSDLHTAEDFPSPTHVVQPNKNSAAGRHGKMHVSKPQIGNANRKALCVSRAFGGFSGTELFQNTVVGRECEPEPGLCPAIHPNG